MITLVTEPPVKAESQSTSSDAAGHYHTVEQGQCIESIAYDHGFFWKTIWSHANNAHLKSIRKDPNVLFPGDQVFVPEKCCINENAVTDRRHRFIRKGVPSKLRIRLLDHEGQPRSGEDCRLIVEGTVFLVRSDDQGRIEVPILPNARKGRLIIGDEDDLLYEEYDVALGGLDPISEITGVQARLSNLRFYNGPIHGEMDQETIEAIMAFQASQGLEPNGELTGETEQELKKSHGF